MNVLYLINHAGKAGTEKYVYNLVNAYNEKKCNCFFAYNEPGLLSEQMEEMNIKSFKVEMKNPFDLKAAKALAKICRENNIDIIHTQYPRENYIAILSRLFYKKVKVIYTCHLTLPVSRMWKITNSLITPHQEKILSVCNNGKELLTKGGVNPDKIDVIFNGVFYKGEPDRTSTIREELNISEDTFVISTLARYHMAKGLDYFVRAVAEFDKIATKKYVVLIAGEGELFGEIKNLIHSYGLQDKILQLGFRRDSENILKGSDVFVNSAKCYEALSFAILEALSNKLPVIATNVGGNGDIINKDTDCGFLVEYGDENAIAKALKELSENEELYKKFSENALKTIENRFNLDILLEDIFKQYESALK